jgi:hypothetical protein
MEYINVMDIASQQGEIVESISNRQVTLSGNTLIVPANPDRKYLLILNISSSDIYICFGNEATQNTGIPLPPQGSYEFNSFLLPFYGDVYASSYSGDISKVAIMEGI